MKRANSILIPLVFVLLSLGGCSNFFGSSSTPQTAQVRIENLLTENGSPFEFLYGVRIGTNSSAEYDGVLAPGGVTPYYSLAPGTYSIEGKTSTGSWITISASSGTLTATSGHFTIVLSGDLGTSNTATISTVQDSSN